MLLAVAVIGIGLAAVGEVWSAASQRSRERELIFIGHEFRGAIERYYEQTPGGIKRFPIKLEDLLEDNRYPMVRRHLRKLYRDPMTGKAQWGLVKAPDGGVQGVYSLSDERPIKQSGFEPADQGLQGAPTLSGWRFVYEPATVVQKVNRGQIPSAPSAKTGSDPREKQV
jgi:type II secretory pathway pseudopilin PulG